MLAIPETIIASNVIAMRGKIDNPGDTCNAPGMTPELRRFTMLSDSTLTAGGRDA